MLKLLSNLKVCVIGEWSIGKVVVLRPVDCLELTGMSFWLSLSSPLEEIKSKFLSLLETPEILLLLKVLELTSGNSQRTPDFPGDL